MVVSDGHCKTQLMFLHRRYFEVSKMLLVELVLRYSG